MALKMPRREPEPEKLNEQQLKEIEDRTNETILGVVEARKDIKRLTKEVRRLQVENLKLFGILSTLSGYAHLKPFFDILEGEKGE